MIRTVLVPLDASSFSEHALPLARRVAQRTGAAIELVMVHDPVRDPLLSPAAATAARQLDAAERDAVEHYLASVADSVRNGVEVRTRAVEGDVVPTLREQVSATGADLVVMCTHGRGGWSRLWLGSVAQELVRQVDVPLLLTRPHGEEEGQTQPPPPSGPLRVLVTLDGSRFAEQALDTALRLVGETDAEYTLLRVVVPPVVYPYRSPKAHPDYAAEQELREAAQAYLDGVVARLRERGVSATAAVISRQRVAEGIADFAREEGMHVVAIATHAREGMPRLVLGSVADKVLRASTVPVLVMRPAESGD